MSIEMRTCTAADGDELFRVDGRNFGSHFTPEEMQERLPIIEWDRFQVAVDRGSIVSTVGVFTLDVTVPGGAAVPLGGITWVNTSATHRRRGLMAQLIERAHRDSAERGEPMTGLGASESAIYGRFGYGVSTWQRRVAISTSTLRMRPQAPVEGEVWFEHDAEALRAHVLPLWEAGRRQRTGEVCRPAAWWDLVFAVRARPEDGATPAYWLLHEQGYVAYRVSERWNDGHPSHRLDVVEMIAVTDEARAALWNTLLSMDLVGEITAVVPPDDPMPYWLDNYRAVRTTSLNDWLWFRPHDAPALFAARTYGTTDGIVVQIDDARMLIDGSPHGATVSPTDRPADLRLAPQAVGPLLMGGRHPRVLASAGLLAVDDHATLHRAAQFFLTDPLPYGQMMF
jgi:predicted acetyltransferase